MPEPSVACLVDFASQDISVKDGYGGILSLMLCMNVRCFMAFIIIEIKINNNPILLIYSCFVQFGGPPYRSGFLI